MGHRSQGQTQAMACWGYVASGLGMRLLTWRVDGDSISCLHQAGRPPHWATMTCHLPSNASAITGLPEDCLLPLPLLSSENCTRL